MTFSDGSRGGRTAVVAAGCFAALAVGVKVGVVDGLDDSLRQVFRPHDVWGPVQWKADVVVEALRPEILVPVVILLAAVLCVVRRSAGQALLAAGTAVLATVLILGTKLLVGRPDPHHTLDSHGGSFPSGHTAVVVVFGGLACYLLRPEGGRLRWLVPAIAGLAMAIGLVIEAAHWTTDVIGGGLLGVAVLGAMCWAGESGRPWWRRGISAHVPTSGRSTPRTLASAGRSDHVSARSIRPEHPGRPRSPRS